MNPSNEAQAPIGRVQADDARTDLIQTHRPGQQALCEGSIMWIGRRKQKQQRQARPTTDERVHTEAVAPGKGMVSGSVSVGGIWVTPSDSTRMGALSMIRSRAPISRLRRACRTTSTNRDSCTGAPAAWRRLQCCDGLTMRGCPSLSKGKPQARAKAGQLFSQSCISWYDKRHKVRKRLMSSKLSSL